MDDAAIEHIRELLDAELGIDSLWLYGSQAAGHARADSDIDLAALFRSPPTTAQLIELRGALAARLHRSVDLVDLDEASPLLAYQVLRHGRLLLDRNPSRRYRFAAAVPGRREDLLHVRRPIEDRLIGRIASGSAGG